MVSTTAVHDLSNSSNSTRRRVDRQSDLVGKSTVPKPKLSRRRHIDPTTCEREYGADELEFMKALDDYKRSSGRMFPTCSEVLEVVRSLGYVRMSSEMAECSGLHR